MLKTLCAIALLLCARGAKVMAASAPTQPPPPPPTVGALVIDALRAFGGEWQLVSIDAKPVERTDVLIVWAPAFSLGSGCEAATGQLRDIGAGRFAIQHYGMPLAGCTSLVPPPPFGGAEFRASLAGPESLMIEVEGRKWSFAKVDVTATVARDDFVRGAWLLADADGKPYRGNELTRVTFNDRGYSIKGPRCSYQENGWITDRDWIVRPGGDQVVQSRKCRAATLGDKLVRQGSGVRYTAEPVESRMRVKIGSVQATLVPAARFPELAKGVAAIAPDSWAILLAKTAQAKLNHDEMQAFALRAVGLSDVPYVRTGEGDRIDFRRLAFAGLSSWHYLAAANKGLLPTSDRPASDLRQHVASAPIAVVATLEGIVPAERGDGLALDYSYRVEETWRGDRRPGDVVIVRMPPLVGKNVSPLITPEAGTKVLLLASRTGYVFGRLIEGMPPSVNRRVVAMTLPLMRVRDRRLVEAVTGANVLGAEAFASISLDQARALAIEAETAIAAVKGPPTSSRRYFMTRIGTSTLADPTLLWFDFDHQLTVANRARRGGVTRYISDCAEVVRAGTWWTKPDVGCGLVEPDFESQRLLIQAVNWAEANGLSEGDITSGGGAGPYPTILIPLSETTIEFRPMLK